MHKKFEINWTKIKGDCQSGRKVATPDSKSDLPLALRLKENTFLIKALELHQFMKLHLVVISLTFLAQCS